MMMIMPGDLVTARLPMSSLRHGFQVSLRAGAGWKLDNPHVCFVAESHPLLVVAVVDCMQTKFDNGRLLVGDEATAVPWCLVLPVGGARASWRETAFFKKEEGGGG